jgi:hypothetical protein
MASFVVRDLDTILNVILPIFDQYPLLTSKFFNYDKFRTAANILSNKKLSNLEKNRLLFLLKEITIPLNYVSPA